MKKVLLQMVLAIALFGAIEFPAHAGGGGGSGGGMGGSGGGMGGMGGMGGGMGGSGGGMGHGGDGGGGAGDMGGHGGMGAFGSYPSGAGWGSYGARTSVQTGKDAKAILQQYYAKDRVKIGRIMERKGYFEAEIKAENGRVVDVVIIDKGSGRIRSIQ